MTVSNFVNEPFTDFSTPENHEAFEAAIQHVEHDLGRDYPLVLGGRRVTTGEWVVSANPSVRGQVIGRVARGRPSDADAAIESAERAFPSWSRVPAADRAAVGLRAATLLRARRYEWSALLVLEVGKNWAEADADTAEAIDFLEFYAREAIRLDEAQPLTAVRGTANSLSYMPLGVGVAIPPWNFPLAIAMGLVGSAMLVGNTVVLKPSSLAPVVGARLVELLEEAGLPAGVVNLVPGPGEAVGDYLVSHPRVRFVNFTGSRDVGLHISEVAARVCPGQRWTKRVLAEMGGKNAIIVHQSGNVDDAAAAITASAFGFQGQKCSACSRVIADDAVYADLLERVVRRTEALKMGPARHAETDVGPLIDAAQFQKVASYVDDGRADGHLVAGGERDDTNGFFHQPTVFADVPPDARLMQEEIFGPVVAFTRSRGIDEALAIANGTDYGLTGGVFARDPAVLAQARREFHVGNLYFNRKITGALVGVEPFGGFDMSGTNAKAGGRDYLRLLVQAKVVSERV